MCVYIKSNKVLKMVSSSFNKRSGNPLTKYTKRWKFDEINNFNGMKIYSHIKNTKFEKGIRYSYFKGGKIMKVEYHDMTRNSIGKCTMVVTKG
jgi:hypothetical protein